MPLFLAALRIGPRRALDVGGGLRHALGAMAAAALAFAAHYG
jgi:hypothetical protein